MSTVWAVFLFTAAALLALALVGLRRRGETGPVFHTVGRFLLVLAVVTALFPSALEGLGAALWAATYIGFVVFLTAVMTTAAIRRARRRHRALARSQF